MFHFFLKLVKWNSVAAIQFTFSASEIKLGRRQDTRSNLSFILYLNVFLITVKYNFRNRDDSRFFLLGKYHIYYVKTFIRLSYKRVSSQYIMRTPASHHLFEPAQRHNFPILRSQWFNPDFTQKFYWKLSCQ